MFFIVLLFYCFIFILFYIFIHIRTGVQCFQTSLQQRRRSPVDRASAARVSGRTSSRTWAVLHHALPADDSTKYAPWTHMTSMLMICAHGHRMNARQVDVPIDGRGAERVCSARLARWWGGAWLRYRIWRFSTRSDARFRCCACLGGWICVIRRLTGSACGRRQRAATRDQVMRRGQVNMCDAGSRRGVVSLVGLAHL